MAARTFEDSAGELWEVFEVHRSSTKALAVSAGHESGWLAFVSGERKRRLAPYPADWETIPIPELEQLCASARAVPVPRSLDRAPRVPRPARRDDVRTARSQVSSGASGGGDVEAAVREFAHETRLLGVPVIDAMVKLKAMLLDRFPGPGSPARDLRSVRRWFVESYYFARDA
jgi:hypothetical protein